MALSPPRKFYQGLRSGKWKNHIDEWESVFLSDDHSVWYMRANNQVKPDSQPTGSGQAEGLSDARAEGARSNPPEIQRSDARQEGDSSRSASDSNMGSSGENQSNLCFVKRI